MKVFIVDDEEDICKHLQRELKKEGCKVEYTTSAVGVTEKIYNAKSERRPYELLLLDLRMPKVSGFELLREIRETQLDMDVIIITGYGDEDKAIEAVRLGVVDYLTKPISLDQLHTAIFRVQQKRADEAKQALRHSILVVDDEKGLCTRIKRELEKEGYQVAVAYNGVQGLDYFVNNRVDVAIVDIKMPKMSGLEMLEKFREITDNFVSIIITGHGDHEKAIEALKLGVLNYLRKPISLEELVASVRNGIDLIYLRRGLSARTRELEIETALKEQHAKRLEKRVEEGTRELRESEKLYKSLYQFNEGILQNSPAGIIRLDKELRVEYENPETKRIPGVPSGEESKAMGMNIREIPWVKEAGIKHIFNDLPEGREIYAEVPFTSLYGKEAYLHIKGVPIFENGEFTGAVLLISDVTERKQAEQELKESEEKYRTLVESSTDAILMTNKERNVVTCNQAFLDLFGYKKREIEGKSLRVIHQSDDSFRSYGETAYPVIEGVRSLRMEWEFMHKDGTIIPVETVTSAIRSPDGSITGYIAIIRDITERKQAEEEHNKLQSQLEQAQRMEAIGTLASGITHDFNNILSAVIGYTELARLDVSEGSKAQANLQEVYKAGIRAKDLVGQILAFSRQREPEQKPVRISSIIKESLRLLRPSLPTTIEIRQNIQTESDTVLADPGQIHQVLMNLCTNAAHAMHEKGGVLELTLEEVYLDPDEVASYPGLTSGPYVRLTVSDTGHGMNRRVMKRIFDPYFTTKEKGVGTGLGLAVVDGIVKTHGGTITAYSEPEKGATFHVYLPRIEHPEAVVEPEEIEPLPKGHERILFVDDEKPLVDIGKQMLERLGYQVTARTSSTEALEAFRAQPEKFDIVITDQTMPTMTGETLAKELTQIRPDIPIILCTGYSQILSKGKLGASGIREVLRKPIVTREMAKTIRRVLDKSNGE